MLFVLCKESESFSVFFFPVCCLSVVYGLTLLRKKNLGPVVQSIVSLTSSFAVIMLTLLVSTISNSQVFLLKKCEMQKLLTFC